MAIDIFEIEVGDKLKVKNSSAWWTVERIKELETKVKKNVLRDRIFYFVEPRTPVSGPNVIERQVQNGKEGVYQETE